MCRNKPVQHGSRPRIGRQLSTLVALAVGEEDQPSPQAAQHHQAGRGNGVAGCTRDGHGFRHRLPGRAGRVQPRGELTQRVSVQVCDIHPPSLAPPITGEPGCAARLIDQRIDPILSGVAMMDAAAAAGCSAAVSHRAMT